jgi:transposase, IS30 family
VLAIKHHTGMHKHLNRDCRVALGTLICEGYSQTDIADHLGVHRSTVSRELCRNAGERGKYHASSASVFARERRRLSKANHRKVENDVELATIIESKLEPLVSPEVVAKSVGVHHQTIYNFVYRSRPDLRKKLPYRGKKRRKYGTKRATKQGWTKNIRSVHNKPDVIISWEGDTIKGSGRSRVLTHVECTSLYTRADKILDGTADSVHAVLKKKPIPYDITYDRGSEFALWKMIEKDTGATVRFADPHSPWQRPRNENTNGRIRRVYPKRFDFDTITQKQLDTVFYKMNHTPRKSLGWKTPAEVYEKLCCISG